MEIDIIVALLTLATMILLINIIILVGKMILAKKTGIPMSNLWTWNEAFAPFWLMVLAGTILGLLGKLHWIKF